MSGFDIRKGIRTISTLTGVPEEDVLSRRSDRATFFAKVVLSWHVCRLCPGTLREKAALLGCTHADLIYRRRFMENSRRNPWRWGRLHRLDADFVKAMEIDESEHT